MKGICDSDPMDEAIDVCAYCGGEFCSHHLIYHRGERKPPVCKKCARDSAGIRAARSKERIGRREHKKRREELQTSLARRRGELEPEPVEEVEEEEFVFADLQTWGVQMPGSEPAPAASSDPIEEEPIEIPDDLLQVGRPQDKPEPAPASLEVDSPLDDLSPDTVTAAPPIAERPSPPARDEARVGASQPVRPRPPRPNMGGESKQAVPPRPRPPATTPTSAGTDPGRVPSIPKKSVPRPAIPTPPGS